MNNKPLGLFLAGMLALPVTLMGQAFPPTAVSPAPPQNASGPGNLFPDAPTPKEKEIIDKQITEFFLKNRDKGYSMKQDAEGYLMIFDKEGKEIQLPDEVLAVPGKPTQIEVEKRIIDFAEKNKNLGCYVERDAKGFLKLKDKEGKEMPIPAEILNLKPGEKSSADQTEDRIHEYVKQNRDKGYYAERDGQGLLKIRDKAGQIVPMPPTAIESFPPNRSKQDEISIIESKILNYANSKGYTTERDPSGFLILKNTEGKMIPVPPEVIGMKAPFQQTPDEIRELEEMILDFAKTKNYKAERDSLGHLVIKDQKGETVLIPPDLFDAPENVASLPTDTQPQMSPGAPSPGLAPGNSGPPSVAPPPGATASPPASIPQK